MLLRPPPPRHARRALLAIGLAAVVVAATPPVAAAPRTAGGPAEPSASAPAPATLRLAQPSPDLPGLPAVSPALADVAVDSPALRRARAGYDEADSALTAEQAGRVRIDRTLAELAARDDLVRADLVAARARAAGARARLEVVDAGIADLAVRLYTSGGASARVDAALASGHPAINDSDRRDVLGSASMDVLLAERTAYQARLDDARARIDAADAELKALADERHAQAEDHPAAAEAELAAAGPVAERRVAYEGARVLATVEGVEFPLVALDAYYRAAASSAADDPACGVRWWAIAGISRVEGRHGTYGGAVLDERGDPSERIIGIQLNGTRSTRVVADSDGGTLDGDPVYDRAVGPMQFIPQTWSRFAADGNADGVATPFNLYDATLAAARYLCGASTGLGADPGLRAAYFSYNHSDAYVEHVLSFARRYERTISVAEPAIDPA